MPDYRLVPVDHNPFGFVPVDHDPFADIDPSTLSPLGSDPASRRAAQLGQIRDYLTPEYAKPFAGMSPQQAESEAKILASGNQAPGKIGPGYLSDSDRVGLAAADAASWLAPEVKAGAVALKGMAGVLPKAESAAAEVLPKSVRGFHGTTQAITDVDLQKGGSRANTIADKGVAYFYPNEKAASNYGKNIISKDINLENAKTYDATHLVDNDPQFMADMREAFLAQARNKMGEKASTLEGQASIDRQWKAMVERMSQDSELSSRNQHGQVRYNPAITGAILKRAREEGADVAVVRNMAEGHGPATDQYLVLNRRAFGEPEAESPKGITAYHGSPDFASLLASHGPDFANATVIDHQGNVLHNPISRESVGGPMLRVNADGSVTRGILAYHGSPHDFDKFDISKIGTGEGAQAYGHGLYFAENEGVAGDYRRTLAGKGLPLREIVEKHLPEETLTQGDLGKIYSAANNGDKDAEKAAKSVQAGLPHLRDQGVSFLGPPGEKGQKIANAIAELRDKGRGRMYQVSINADPEHFLDWDKPLSEQSEHVKSALGKYGMDVNRYPGISHPSDLRIKDPGDVAELHAAGIPGIKYLDQGSRSAGEGSRNYVVFDDRLIDILKKYGLAGMIAGGAYHFQTSSVDHDPFAQ